MQKTSAKWVFFKRMNNQEEIWKDVEGYDGEYQVSNLGRVKSFKVRRGICRRVGGFFLKPAINVHGYLIFQLTKDRKATVYPIHRLVATTFIPNPENKKTVNHIDGNKKNNSIENLEWATHSENSLHHVKNSLRFNGNYKGKIKVFDKFGNFIHELSGEADMRSKGYTPQSVSRCIKGTQKYHKGLIFKRIPETWLDKKKDVVYGIFQGLKCREIFEKTGVCARSIWTTKKLLKENNILSLEDFEKYLNRDKEGV